MRRHLVRPGRLATLKTPELIRLSRSLGGVPAALCAAGARLAIQDVDEVLASPPVVDETPATSAGLRQRVLQALGSFDGPVTTQLLGQLLDADAQGPVSELLAEGRAEVYPSGSLTVRLRPGGPLPPPLEDPVALRESLVQRLPAWEDDAHLARNRVVWAPHVRLQRDLPALERLLEDPNPEVALRTACVVAVVLDRFGPRHRILALEKSLPEGGSAETSATWALAIARAAIGLNDPAAGLAALEHRPAPPGTLLAVEQDVLRARLLALSGEADQGARLRTEVLTAATGTPLEPAALYGDAVGRYWEGDFDGALAALTRCLACSDPETHSLRVVRATILRVLLGRDRREDSGALAAEMTAIDRFWRHPACRDRPVALALTAGLLTDLGRWREARALLTEAITVWRKLGRLDDAVTQVLQREVLSYATGRVPDLDLEQALDLPPDTPLLQDLSARALSELSGWRAVRAAALGQVDAALAELGEAEALLTRIGRPLRTTEFRGFVAAGLVGSGVRDRAVLDPLLQDLGGSPALDHMAAQLACALDRGPPPAPPHLLEERLLAALLARERGLRVASDGRWLQTEEGERVSLARKVVLRRALAAFASAPDGLSLGALIARTWPGQRLVGASGRRRAEVAISSLRSLGVGEALVTESGPEGTRWRLDAVVVPMDEQATARG